MFSKLLTGKSSDEKARPAPAAAAQPQRTVTSRQGSVFLYSTVPGDAAEFYTLRLDATELPFRPLGADAVAFVLDENHLHNGDFAAGSEGWRYVAGKQPGAFGVDLHPDWTLANGHTAFVKSPRAASDARVVYVDPAHGERVPVREGYTYLFTGLFGLHRCTADLTVELLDATGRAVHRLTAPVDTRRAGGQSIDSYSPAALSVRIPAGVVAVRLAIVQTGFTGAGGQEPDSYVFFTRCVFRATALGSADRWAPRRTDLPYVIGVDRPVQVFRADVPAELRRRTVDSIAVVDRRSLEPLTTQLFESRFLAGVSGGIDRLDKHGVAAWVGAGAEASIDVELFVDDEPASVFATVAVTPGTVTRYRLEVPEVHLDGRLHVFSARTLFSGRPLGRFVGYGEAPEATWSTLRARSRAPLRFELAPTAGLRYRAFEEAVAALVGKPDAAERLAQLAFLHQVLVQGAEGRYERRPLVFPEVARPKASVIVPVHNKFPVTYVCLAALLLAVNDTAFEVVLVDDGSSDETRAVADLVTGITVVRRDNAGGFVDACMAGAAAARGEYLVFLNNDTEPSARWLDELVFAFETFADVGLAGSKLLYPDGRLQEAGGIVWGSGDPWNYGRLANPNHPKFNYTRQADYVSGASLMVPRAVWDAVGGFGEEFRPGYFEDTDLAFKVRAAGLKTVYVPHSVVVHYEGVSSDKSTTTGMKRFQEINRPKFKRKWAAAYERNGRESLPAADLEKDRGVWKRALVIDHVPPRPDNDAGSYALIQEMRMLQALGFKVTFLPNTLEYYGVYTDNLQRLGIESIYAPFAGSVEDFLREHAGEFDLVFICRYQVAQRFVDLVRMTMPKAKILFNNADLHFLREMRAAVLAGDGEAVARALSTQEEELAIMRKVDLTLSYNDVEHAIIFTHTAGEAQVAKLPWVVEIEKDVAPFAARADIGFLGGYGHPPNVEAVEFFVGSVMPLLRGRLPGVRFRVFGSAMPPRFKELARDDVEMVGFIETLDEVYQRCRLFVAPLLTGAGIKGKVIGAMAAGIPIVMSPVAAEGIACRDGYDCRIAETPEAWAEAIVALYGDEARWSAVSRNAQAFAEENFSFATGVRTLRRGLEKVDLYPPAAPTALVSTSGEPNLP